MRVRVRVRVSVRVSGGGVSGEGVDAGDAGVLGWSGSQARARK